jgi:CubicO group peptidase (beta-lactamase class C family)
MKKIHWLGAAITAVFAVVLLLWPSGPASEVPFMNEELVSSVSGDQQWGIFQVWAPKLDSCTDPDRLKQAVDQLGPMALMLEGLPVSDFRRCAGMFTAQSGPVLASRAYPLLHGHFSHTPRLPKARTLAAIPHREDDLRRMSIEQTLALGLDVRVLPVEAIEPGLWNQVGVLAFARPSLPRHLDTVRWLFHFQEQLRPLIEDGLSGLYLDRAFWEHMPLHPYLLRKILREDLQFEGLLLAEYAGPQLALAQLSADADLWLTGREGHALARQMEHWRRTGRLPAGWEATKRMRLQKVRQWMQQPAQAFPVQASLAGAVRKATDLRAGHELDRYFGDRCWEYLRWKWQQESMVLASNPQQLLPLRNLTGKHYRLWTLSERTMRQLSGRLEKFVRLEEVHTLKKNEALRRALPAEQTDPAIHILALDQVTLDPQLHQPFLESLSRLALQQPVVVLNFDHPENLRHLPANLAVVQSFEHTDHALELAADLIFCSFSPTGRLPEHYAPRFPKGHGLTFSARRVHYSLPQEAGIAPEKLVGIDAIARTAIEKGAMPGCQVAVAVDGRIVYSKAFGRHTYQQGAPEVRTTDLYDLASITKVAATTLMTMKLYEQDAFELNDRLRRLLELERGSRLRSISLKELLTHQTGLPAVMPILPILQHRGLGNNACDLFFCSSRTAPYLVQMADSFYFDQRYYDTIWQQVQALPLTKSPNFRYNDVNFMLLQRILEAQAEMPLDQWVSKNLYEPMGLRHLTFRPRGRFPARQIVPTEKDERWRRQLVHGYVHDPVAALFGGVSGHAGLFGNAEDLAVLFYMLANGGAYGGMRFLEPGTIDRFTTAQWGNHRGLGFDKPGHRTNRSAHADAVSAETYGHTGFTGTCVWVDPREKLVFVFLSNRIHPTRRNTSLIRDEVRKRIHQVAYDALHTFDPSVPVLLPPEKTNDFFPMH